MSNAAKLQVVVEADIGPLEKGMRDANQSVTGFGSKMGGLGGVVSGAFKGVGSAIGGVVEGFGKLGLAAAGVGAAIDGVKGIGNLFGIGALNELEQTRASFMAFTKDAGKTEELLAGVRKEAALTPFAFGEMAKATASLLPVAKSSGVGIDDLRKQAEILAASNPMEGLEGASFSLREAMTGDFTSIIERFNLSRSSINKWKEEGVPNIEIVRRAMNEMGFDSDLIAAKAETLDGRWSTFQDTLTTLQTKMGEPIFNAMKEGLVGLQGALDDNMPLLEGLADTVATTLTSAIGGAKTTFQEWWPTIQQVGAALGSLFDIFKGGDDFEGAGSLLDNFFPPELSDQIMAAVSDIGAGFRFLVSDVLPAAWEGFKQLSAIVLPIVAEVATAVLEKFTQITGWFRENMPLIQQTVQTVLGVIGKLWDEHGATIMTVIQSAWTIINTVISTSLGNLLDVIKIGMQLITGDWSGAWDTLGGMLERSWNAYGVILGAAWDALYAVIDDGSGGALTKIKTWLDDTSAAISGAWDTIKSTAQTAWDTASGIGSAIAAGWEAIKTTTDQALNTAGTGLVDLASIAWGSIKSGVDTAWTAAGGIAAAIGSAWDTIKTTVTDALNATGTGIVALASAGWDAVKSGIDTVFGAGTGDTITGVVAAGWENIKANTKLLMEDPATGVKQLLSNAWGLVKVGLDTVFGDGTGDTITGVVAAGWNAISAGAKTLMEDPTGGIKAILSGGWSAVKTGLDTIFGAGTGDTITGVIKSGWDSISSTTEALFGEGKGVRKLFSDAMGVMKAAVDPLIKILAGENGDGGLIGFITKLKSIMPEWLIPHSPTPFEIGLRGIMKAATAMDGAFGNMGQGLEGIAQVAALATSIGGVDFGRAAAAISASETGGGRSLLEQGGTGAVGPFQFDPGGELKNFARDLHVSISEAARIAMAEPMKAAAWALQGYLGTALRAGIGQGLSGADLAMFGSRYGQRPYGDNWKKAGDWYQQLYPGYADGGIAWTKQLAWVAEKEPEVITPFSAIRAGLTPGGQSGGDVYIDLRGAQVYDGSRFEDLMVRALERAGDRGRITKVTR